MGASIPSSKPQAKRDAVVLRASRVWAKANSGPMPPVFLVGVRGYYQDSMGKVGVNDRGIYDDAIFVFGPESVAAFNANTDPSKISKGVASLVPGVHLYKPGNHGISKPGGGYPAFRPATKGEALPVKRDGENAVPSKTPGIAINIHKGGYNTTSSLGCQTIYPSQWEVFQKLVMLELKQAGVKTFPYILLDGPMP